MNQDFGISFGDLPNTDCKRSTRAPRWLYRFRKRSWSFPGGQDRSIAVSADDYSQKCCIIRPGSHSPSTERSGFFGARGLTLCPFLSTLSFFAAFLSRAASRLARA